MKKALLLSCLLIGVGHAQTGPSQPAASAPAAPRPYNPVFEGKDGYLFLDYEFAPVKPEQLASLANNLKQVSDLFARYGTQVVFTVAPAKLTLLPEYVTTIPGNAKYDVQRYPGLIAAIKKVGLNTVDILPTLQKAKSTGKYPVWMFKDSHWAPMGGYQAGYVIGTNLQNQKLVNSIPPVKFTYSEEVKIYKPDLYKLSLDDVKSRFTDSEKVVTPVVANKSNDLLGDSEPQIVLFGSSYSNLPYEGIAPGIMMGSSRDVLNISANGGGIWASINAFMNYKQYKGQPPKIIVWELPERYAHITVPDAGLEPTLKSLELFLQR